MSASWVALLGFAAWTVALVFGVLLYRTALVFSRKKPANAWPRGEKPPADEPGVITRMGQAHQNCAENLPVFGAIVVAAAISGQLGVTDPVALWVLYARIGQSLTHLVGASHWLVFVRANFFTIQLLLYGYMIWGLLT